jgi:hypothetical protein
MNILNKKIIKKYDVGQFKFYELFIKHLQKYKIKNIENSHKDFPKELMPKKVLTVKNDQDHNVYKFLYKIDPAFNLKNNGKSSHFLKTYKSFVSYIAKNIFKESLVFQKRPTFRIMFPNNLAVGGFHRDREYNHPLEEINIWVPITSAVKTNTIWLESSFDKKDYRPANLKYGQFLIFDSGLKHGNKLNIENKTRLSFDFRVIPLSKWKPTKKGKVYKSLSRNLKFSLGDYYDLVKVNNKLS